MRRYNTKKEAIKSFLYVDNNTSDRKSREESLRCKKYIWRFEK